jgi:hypothetical protein
MPIKDKDGNVYRLRGPNPVMKTQDQWDKNKVKLINFDFEEEIVSGEKNDLLKKVLNKPTEENVLVLGTSVKETPIEVKPPEPVKIPEIQPLEPVKIPEPVSIKAPIPQSNDSKTSGEAPDIYDNNELTQHKVQIYCLPIFEKLVKDELYGDSYILTSYGTKFHFEGIVVEEEDLYCTCWSERKIPSKAIIYPRNQSRRWWQVQSVEPERDGYLIHAAPTQENPDFTD